MNPVRARHMARSLHAWGYEAIQIVEQFPSGETFVRCRTPVGTQRWCNNEKDFIELREAAANEGRA